MDGNRLRQRRKDNGYTQAELGKKVGVIKQTISNWENNISEPNNDVLIKLSNILNTQPNYLLGLSDKEDFVYVSGDDFPKILHNLVINCFSEEEISEQLNISISQLRKLETGEEMPSADVLFSIAQLFDKSTDNLLGISNKERTSNIKGKFPFYMDSNCLKRLQALLENDSDEYYASELGLTYEEFFWMFHYGFVVHISVLQKICEDHQVSADYLFHFSDSKLIIDANNDEDVLLTEFRQLNPLYKKKMLGILSEQLIQQQRDEYLKESVAADEPLKKTGTTNSTK